MVRQQIKAFLKVAKTQKDLAVARTMKMYSSLMQMRKAVRARLTIRRTARKFQVRSSFKHKKKSRPSPVSSSRSSPKIRKKNYQKLKRKL